MLGFAANSNTISCADFVPLLAEHRHGALHYSLIIIITVMCCMKLALLSNEYAVDKL